MMTVNVPLEPRIVKSINIVGLMALSQREIARWAVVYSQTIIGPVVTTMLFYAVFALAFGGFNKEIGGIPFLQFLAPGLIMMAMAQNAFGNTSSSIIISKVQGNIVDILMPPLSAGELLAGFLIGGVMRGLAVGGACLLALALFVPVVVHSFWMVILFALLGNLLLTFLGIIGGIVAQKFDHVATFANFFITPLTFLSGTFYSLESLPAFWRMLGHANPFFYMIDGFRAGFIGHADGSLFVGFVFLSVVNIGLCAVAYWMLKTGYRIKS